MSRRVFRPVLAGILVLAFTFLGVPVGSVEAAAVRIDPLLVERLEAASADDRLVVFVHADDVETSQAAVREAGLGVVDTWDTVGVTVTAGTPGQIDALRSADGVTYLEADRPIELFTDSSHIATRGAEAIEGFSYTTETFVGSEEAKGPEKGNVSDAAFETTTEEIAVDGSGVTVAVVDSGIDGNHPSFARPDGTSKVVRNLKLACIQTTPVYSPTPIVPGTTHTPPSLCPEDYEQTNTPETRSAQWIDLGPLGNDTDTPSLGGHGTHVASIAAGVEQEIEGGRVVHGAAPGADLVGLSIGNALSIYGGNAGLNWVLEHHADPCSGSCPPIKVVNNSWGIQGGADYDPDSATAKIQDALVAAGVTVVWAAGNDGGDGSANVVSGPAQSPTGGVLGVANYSDGDTGNRNNALDPTSSRGEEGRPETYPDISAPGTNILAACSVQLPICKGTDTADPQYNAITGTSMAAPHIAGIAAQLVEANPDATPAQIEKALEDGAHEFVFGGAYTDDPRNPDSQTSFDKGHGLVDVVAAIGELLDVPAPAAAEACDGGDVVIVDAAGDATAVIVGTPAPSEPSLDILEGRMSWDGEALTATIAVADLTDGPPQGATGRYNRYYFTHDGVEYYFVAARDDVGEEFRLVDTSQGTTGTTIVEALDGTFDAEADEIRITLTAEQFAEAKPDAAPLADGVVLSGFEILAQRYFVAVTPTADTAGAVCPYVLGEGAVTPQPVEPEPEEADGTVSASSPTYEWQGEPTTDSRFLFGCQGISGNTCDVTEIEVVVPEGGATSFDVSITTDLPEVDDFDLYVVDPAGVEHGEPPFGSNESVSIPEPSPGVYKIRVEAFLTFEATYSGTATLSV